MIKHILSEPSIPSLVTKTDDSIQAMGSKEAADTASSLYSQGNEAFVNEDYRGAIELYSGALTHHPLFAALAPSVAPTCTDIVVSSPH